MNSGDPQGHGTHKAHTTPIPFPYKSPQIPIQILWLLLPCGLGTPHVSLKGSIEKSLRQVSGKLCSNPARHTAVARGIPSWYHGVQSNEQREVLDRFLDCLGNFPNPFRKSWKLTYLKLWIVEIIYHWSWYSTLFFLQKAHLCRKNAPGRVQINIFWFQNMKLLPFVLCEFSGQKYPVSYWKPHHLPRVIFQGFWD